MTLESLGQMVLVEISALAHNPGMKARVLTGARASTLLFYLLGSWDSVPTAF